jgi:NAD(P)-dependent dehydrogenase (short-subunit alcohol dehydrogenase family)
MNTMQNAVIITGASTGIGLACARKLDALGWRVFAGIREEADADALLEQFDHRIIPVLLDVTCEEQFEPALETVQNQLQNVSSVSLINNAGIVVAGPLGFLPTDALRLQLEVNVIGAVRATQVFLPLIRRHPGRIVLMSSMAGRLGLPFLGPYCMSKFCLEAAGDALRMELKSFGIPVSLIEPGRITTPLWEKSVTIAEMYLNRFNTEALELYGDVYNMMRERALQNATQGTPPERVVETVMHALSARWPRARYRVGLDSKAAALLNLVPDWLKDRLILSKYPM